MSDLRDIIDEIEVEDLLSHLGVDYRIASGGDTLMLDECPHCGRANKANFSISRKVGHCWHADCGERWNIWSFVRKVRETDNAGVAQYLNNLVGRTSSARSRPVPSPVSNAGWKMPESVALPTPEGYTHPYLIGRKITLDSQQRFGLRWCEAGWFNYLDIAGERKGMNFSKRVLLPVLDLDGSLQTFQGRDATGESELRYLFPPRLPGSSHFLYGGHLVHGKTHLVMNEGPIDVIATSQAIHGLPEWSHWGVVGSFGLMIGSDDSEGDHQLGRLRTLMTGGLREVVIMWDGEVNAFREAVKAGAKLRGIGLTVRLAMLPPDKDPAEVDTATIRRAIETAPVLSRENVIIWLAANPYAGRSKK